MIIVEKPYASEFLIDTILQNDWEVLSNNVITGSDIEGGAFEMVSSEDAKNYYLSQEYPMIYSNSENAVGWVLDNLPGSNLAGFIKFCKDKIGFREALKEMFPRFYYKAVSFDELKKMSPDDIHFPVIIKPAAGFMSLGVHSVKDVREWKDAVSKLDKEMRRAALMFPACVINSSNFIIEEYIEGEEYSIDAYYNRNGEPVILNIFQHPFLNSSDVRSRIYLTSTGIMVTYMAKFGILLRTLGQLENFRNFPMNIELRITKQGEIIPIEINPMCFSGWCTADIAKYAWGINVYECFYEQKRPDWNNLLSQTGKETFYYSMAEVPSGTVLKKMNCFQFDKFLANYSNVIELRRINPAENPLFAIVFGSTTNKDEVVRILFLNTKDYIIQ